MTYLDRIERLIGSHQEKLADIKLVAFDVDGVLTNGELHYQADGEVMKVFHVKDGVGLKLLQDFGLEVVVVSAKDSAMVKKRMCDLGIDSYFPGSKNKLAVISSLCDKRGISLDQCAFVGDDMVDVPVMSATGVSFCPRDAYELVAEKADIVLDLDGGKGVARMVADMLLVAKNEYDQAYQLATTSLFERKR